jgi:hypothetical protein
MSPGALIGAVTGFFIGWLIAALKSRFTWGEGSGALKAWAAGPRLPYIWF